MAETLYKQVIDFASAAVGKATIADFLPNSENVDANLAAAYVLGLTEGLLMHAGINEEDTDDPRITQLLALKAQLGLTI